MKAVKEVIFFFFMCFNEGKKAIIVGDEQQISPNAVGINFEQVKKT